MHLVGILKCLPKLVLTKRLPLEESYGEESTEGILIQKWKPKSHKIVLSY